MQELLGRIAALDPTASLSIRVIACFDELIVGKVNTHGLLATAAALAGCPAGLSHGGRTTRVSALGDPLDGPVPAGSAPSEIADGVAMWLERSGTPLANDAIILERLTLAVRIRMGEEDALGTSAQRDIATLLERDSELSARQEAAGRLGLLASGRYRVVAAPLFADWSERVSWPGDVVRTPHGTLHLLIAPEGTGAAPATPSGVGVAAAIADLPASLRTALVAVRLCEQPDQPSVNADLHGGLIRVLAESPPGATNPDLVRLGAAMDQRWAAATVGALLDSSTLRQAARSLGVHHSTMQTRVETLAAAVGFDPIDGYGKARLGMAFLAWRLEHSRVLDLPTPGGVAPNRRRS